MGIIKDKRQIPYFLREELTLNAVKEAGGEFMRIAERLALVSGSEEQKIGSIIKNLSILLLFE